MRDGAAEGTWLRAISQTGGRGRQGRAWQSPPGNLYASTLVRIRPGDPAAATLALVAAVALHEIASAYAPDAGIKIKWPNDLTAQGAKLSGILLERSGDAVVVGFGMNLDQFPQDTPVPSSSIRALTGTAPAPESVALALADSFANWLARWRANGLGTICDHWLAAAHPAGTALSAAVADGSRIDGIFDGLDRDGALRLRLADGTVRVIQAGDVFLI